MNKLIGVALAFALAAPVVSFAQSNQPVTRAQVNAQIVQLEKAGYNPAHLNDAKYPADIQAAEARVDAVNGYGGTADGAAQSGSRGAGVVQQDVVPTFAHH
jgi:hypothetical protein